MFNVGDKVQYKADGQARALRGKKGTIVKIEDGKKTVRFDDGEEIVCAGANLIITKPVEAAVGEAARAPLPLPRLYTADDFKVGDRVRYVGRHVVAQKAYLGHTGVIKVIDGPKSIDIAWDNGNRFIHHPANLAPEVEAEAVEVDNYPVGAKVTFIGDKLVYYRGVPATVKALYGAGKRVCIVDNDGLEFVAATDNLERLHPVRVVDVEPEVVEAPAPAPEVVLEEAPVPEPEVIAGDDLLIAAYKLLQAQLDWNVGDTVKVLRKARDNELGWPIVWNARMDEQVGEIGKITHIHATNGFKIDNKFWYPFYVLDLVRRAVAVKNFALQGIQFKVEKDLIKIGGYAFHADDLVQALALAYAEVQQAAA